jgi:hypothetical protein
MINIGKQTDYGLVLRIEAAELLKARGLMLPPGNASKLVLEATKELEQRKLDPDVIRTLKRECFREAQALARDYALRAGRELTSNGLTFV